MITWKEIVSYCRNGSPAPDSRILKTQSEWESILSPEEFQITRLKGTERAFSSEMCSRFESGKYACTCCGTLLFDSNQKFESGSGWPSFTQPIKPNAVGYHSDHSFGMERVEVICNCCEAHLGHIFPDGPEPSGLRYCINAVSMKKISE